jgi:RimJ/RimL family protein N-acetyltransferase
VHTLVEGEKTRLRPALWGFSDEELRRRYRWSQDDHLQYWSGTIPGGRSYLQFKEMVGQRDWPADGRRVSYAILTKANDLVGMVSVYNIDQRSRTGELGVYIGEQDLWGHGYGTDAVVAFLRHLFNAADFDSVYLHTYESNLRARRSYTRVGFEVVDTRRRYSPRLGYHNEVRMTITRERFARLHPERLPAALG